MFNEEILILARRRKLRKSYIEKSYLNYPRTTYCIGLMALISFEDTISPHDSLIQIFPLFIIELSSSIIISLSFFLYRSFRPQTPQIILKGLKIITLILIIAYISMYAVNLKLEFFWFVAIYEICVRFDIETTKITPKFYMGSLGITI
jgi:hypothetical protein